MIGRTTEKRTLDALIDAGKDRGGALVVRGEAGIGKSALLAYAATRARDRGLLVTVLRGVTAEMNHPFAALHRLVGPFRKRMAALPARQRVALEVAFGTTSGTAPDIFLIGLATLELLGDVAAREPQVVLVEDAQWLDRPSCDALDFVARRLGIDPVVLVFSTRDRGVGGQMGQGIPDLRVGPLNELESEELLSQGLPAQDLSPSARRDLLRLAGGNPLALLELPTSYQAGDGWGIGEPVTLPSRLERAFTARLVELSDDARSVLLVAAADERAELGEILAATELLLGRPVSPDVLSEVEGTDLIRVVGPGYRFHHPLMSSAVYQAASMAQRLTAHRVLGEIFRDDTDRGLWHRAAAVLGPDPEIASQLDEAADRARARGANAIAVTALERAAALSAANADRARRLLLGAELAFELGRPDLARPLLDRAHGLPMTPSEAGRLAMTRELVDPHPDEAAGRSRYLVSVAEVSAADREPDLALDLLWLVASRSWWVDPGPQARARAIETLARLASDRNDPRVLCALGYADAEASSREVVSGLERARDAEEQDPRTAWMLGTTAVVTGAWNLAPGFLRSSIRQLREQGRLGQLPRVLVLQAMVAARMAEWDVALPASEEAKRLALETGQATWVGAAESVVALAAATRGDVATALDAADHADQAVAPIGTTFVRASAQFARATVALQTGSFQEAFDHLFRLFNPSDPAYHWTMKWWGFSDLAQAAARLGRASEVRPLLSQFEMIATHSPAVWVQMNLDHARAYLASDADANSQFEKALSADLRLWPYQRARLYLALGESLRRVRRTAESRGPLREAMAIFDSIGAVGWSERAGHELRASGERVRLRSVPTTDDLTPQELQVAQLAAEGRSNREIAQILYISHRTVGSHLYRAFPKFGISHRSELIQVLTTRKSTLGQPGEE